MQSFSYVSGLRIQAFKISFHRWAGLEIPSSTSNKIGFFAETSLLDHSSRMPNYLTQAQHSIQIVCAYYTRIRCQLRFALVTMNRTYWVLILDWYLSRFRFQYSSAKMRISTALVIARRCRSKRNPDINPTDTSIFLNRSYF